MTNHQERRRPGLLGERAIDRIVGRNAQAGELHVPHDADHRHLLASRNSVAEHGQRDGLPERIRAIAEEAPGGVLAQDDHRRSVAGVGSAEQAPPHQRDPQRFEVARGGRHAGGEIVRAGLAHPSQRNRDAAVVGRQAGADAHRADARNGAHACDDPLHETDRLGVPEMASERRIERRRRDVVRVDAHVGVDEVQQAAPQQARSDQQHERDRHFRSAQHPQRAPRLRPARWSGAAFEGRGRGGPGRTKRRPQACTERRDGHHAKGEEQHRSVHMDAVEPRHARRFESSEHRHERDRHQHAHGGSGPLQSRRHR